ncbi:hypothetical protein JBL43_18645 [Aureibaculum sp. A20]|uniref:DUF4595 domain-containing protein n=1 Tax=Aureibaculum flavum TaxID=2795986 RepID=A0ABS0WWA4_9FLAO|nr:hypothetical protein [Aureibaculum flavum]MBJ2176277.1 hypothetical protein [Aureibaculum flavum]
MKNIIFIIITSITTIYLSNTAIVDTSLITKQSVINGNYILTIDYQYDNEGRIIKESLNNYEINKDGDSIQTTYANVKPAVYKYFTDSILIEVNNTWRKLVLNKKTLFTKDISPNSFSKVKKLTTRLRHTYNSNGFVIKTVLFDDYITYSYSTIYDYEYSNKNLVKETQTNRNIGSDNTVTEDSYYIEYEYFKNKLNSIGNINFGKKYLGKSSKNLIKKEIGSNGYIANYEYEFDKNGNVTKKSIFNNKDGIKTREFNYEYN